MGDRAEMRWEIARLEPRPVVEAEDALHQMRERVIAVVARHVTDAQPRPATCHPQGVVLWRVDERRDADRGGELLGAFGVRLSCGTRIRG